MRILNVNLLFEIKKKINNNNKKLYKLSYLEFFFFWRNKHERDSNTKATWSIGPI